MSIRVWMGLKKHIQDKVRKLSRWYFFAWSMNAPVGTDIFMPRMFFDT
jgi:hypothetical protein